MRRSPAIAALDDHTVVVFGGFFLGELKNGFVFDMKEKSLREILGGEHDISLKEATLAQKVSSSRYVVVGESKAHVHMAELNITNGG